MRAFLSCLLHRFRRDNKGATVMIFGLTLIPIVFGIGMAIDYGRAITAKTRLASAIDSAALAAASWPDLSDSEIDAKILEYFEANFPPEADGTVEPLQITRNEEVITVTANAYIETTFLKVGGINQLEVGAFAEVSLKRKKIELVMVLDNTGSMGWSNKINTLKDAATSLVETLKPGSGGPANSDEVKIGLVPFAAAVNIGADKLGTGWIDEVAQSSIASEDFQPGVNVLDLFNQINNRAWNGCVRARPVPFDTSDDTPSGIADRRWVPYFAPDEPDFWSYSNRYASDGAYGGPWNDYDARQRFVGKYAGLTVPAWESDGPDYNCRIPTLTPMTQTKADAIAGIDAMIASGNTVIPAGLAWGWRLISPSEPFTEGTDYDDEDVVKAIILLTDGRNDVSGGMGNHNNSRYSAFGFAREGHLGSVNGWQAESVLDDKTETLCANIKTENVRLYTITFQLSDGPIKDLMRDCATEPAMYYDSPNNSQLQAVFDDIAKGLNDLRLSK